MGDGVNKRERARVRPAFGALPFFGGQRREARCTVSGGGGCGGDYRTPQLHDVSLDITNIHDTSTSGSLVPLKTH